MTFEHAALVALFAYMVVREVVFWRESQKLINKIMSKNYADYEAASTPAPDIAQQPEELHIPVEGPEATIESQVQAVMEGMF